MFLGEVHWISLEALRKQPDLGPLLHLLTLPGVPKASWPPAVGRLWPAALIRKRLCSLWWLNGFQTSVRSKSCPEFGGDWLRASGELGLLLPSVVVPQARNLLLNPLHPAMAQFVLVQQEAFQLDQRLGQDLMVAQAMTGARHIWCQQPPPHPHLHPRKPPDWPPTPEGTVRPSLQPVLRVSVHPRQRSSNRTRPLTGCRFGRVGRFLLHHAVGDGIMRSAGAK